MRSPGNRQTGSIQPAALTEAFSRSSIDFCGDVMSSATYAQRMARSILFRKLRDLQRGRIVIHEGEQQHSFGDDNSNALTAEVVVTDPAFYPTVVFSGSIGSAESYMQQQWHTPDLLTLVRVMVLNMSVLQKLDQGSLLLARLMNKMLHLRNRNTEEGSRKNIAAHYDLSNEFFASFLDPSMMYSAAIFHDASQSLHEASLNKLTHICERLQLQPQDHLLEIGTGWGAMAIHAAKYYGCKVTTTTLSQEQYDFACERVKAEGLQDRITLLLSDYRDLQGQYDKLVSIEMIEAVGHEYYSSYFSKCSSLLKPQGLMLIQAITISDQRYESAKRSVDFIQRYIFPGGCLPSNEVIARHVRKDTDMQIVGLEDITFDYALTLAHWRAGFLEKADQIESMGFSRSFIRMWDFYLAYCQGGFMERVIHTAQILMAKPDARLQPLHERL